MDDPGLVWPAWKFGMKRDDLYGTLNDQYNTFSSTIQDPEAFHHDVCEISHEAASPEEFHKLMAVRKQQRLHELNESLQTAACEIIANPKLIGSDKWEYALQLFRTRSLDSLIRYFASYLPEHYHMPASSSSSSYSSFDDSTSVKTTATDMTNIDDDAPSFFGDQDHINLTDEPLPIKAPTTVLKHVDIPENGPSLFDDPTDTSASTSSVSSPIHERSMFFNGAHGRRYCRTSYRNEDEDGDFAPSAGPDTPSTSISDTEQEFLESVGARSHGAQHVSAYARSSTVESEYGRSSCVAHAGDDTDDCEDIPTAQFPCDGLEDMDAEETPTPKSQPLISAEYLDRELAALASPCLPSPSRSRNCRSRRSREGSPLQGIQRRSEEPLNRIQKSQQDHCRFRAQARKLQ